MIEINQTEIPKGKWRNAVEELQAAVVGLEQRLIEQEVRIRNLTAGETEVDFSNIVQSIVPAQAYTTDLGDRIKPFDEGHIHTVTVQELRGMMGRIRFAPGTIVDLRGTEVIADDIKLARKEEI